MGIRRVFKAGSVELKMTLTVLVEQHIVMQ